MFFTGWNKSDDDFDDYECMEHHDEIVSLLVDVGDDPVEALASEIRIKDYPGDLNDGEFGQVLCDAFPKLETAVINPPNGDGFKVTGRKNIVKITNAKVEKA